MIEPRGKTVNVVILKKNYYPFKLEIHNACKIPIVSFKSNLKHIFTVYNILKDFE